MSEKQDIKHKDLVIKGTTVVGVKDKYIAKLKIPDGVEMVGDRAFEGLYALEEIEFPASLLSIGEYAFSKCGSLKSVIFTENICEIGEYGFADCQQLVSADLSQAKIKVIPEGAFRECRKLSDITFGTSLREIETSAFSYCQSLKILKLPEGILGVKDSFLGCEFESICIPDTLKYIETISHRKVKSITMSEEQYERFKLVLPKPTEVKYNLTYTIKCPVCGAPYQECKCKNRCSSIEVEGTILKKARVYCSEFIVPEHITVIAERAFYWNDNIETVKLPTSVVEIGKEAFSDCKRLEYVNIHELVNLRSIGDSAFEFCRKLKLHDSSFYKLANLQSVGACAFLETGVERVHFTKLDRLGASAFAGCRELESVSLFKCNTIIEYGAFSECPCLEEVFLPDNLTEIPDSLFNQCESLYEIQIPSKVTKIGKHAFMGCSALTEISMLGPVVSLEKCAFAYCDSLGEDFQFEFLMWDSLERIGESAFSGCTGLTHIEIPENVRYIGPEAFGSCYNMRYMFIPNSVMTIGKDALPTHTTYGVKFDIERFYAPIGWEVDLKDEPYSFNKVNWGYRK